jgi:hypothetical protein
MEFTAIVVALIGVLSGAVAGATNQGIAWLREQKTLKSERAHQARLRQEHAHDDARSSFGEAAADLADWIEYRWSQTVGPDFEYFKHQVMKPRLNSDAEASAAAWSIARRHPTAQVRHAARNLGTTLDSDFFSAEGNPSGEVTDEQFGAMSEATDRLIELIQSPLPAAIEITGH